VRSEQWSGSRSCSVPYLDIGAPIWQPPPRLHTGPDFKDLEELLLRDKNEICHVRKIVELACLDDTNRNKLLTG
jgi:hypothetical protein